jgi:phage baseplate assembly protein W
MKSIAFDNGDLVISSKRLQMVSDLEQKIQRTKGILLTSLGELFYNADIGLDRTEILDIKEKNIQEERKKFAVIQAVMQDDNVEKVDEVTIETNNKERKQTISLKYKYKDEEKIIEIGGIEVE